MPPENDSDSHSDYAELEIAYDGQSANETTDTDFLNDMPEKLKSKAFRAKIENSKSSKSAIRPFLAAVNIDLKRHKPIGLLNLLTVWLEKGNKYWLNPLDK